MKINSAEFVKSSAELKECPAPTKNEFAFIGRSNVGKSSLINMLMQRKDLAKTSGRPGKTQLINHFEINEDWYLVDLPGYGYAKTSKKNRAIFQEMITNYIKKRDNLINTFVLIDCRHVPQKIDLEFMEWCGTEGIPFSIVFTKIDKLGSSSLMKQIAQYKKKLLLQWEALPPVFMTSAEGKSGREEVLRYIDEVNKSITTEMYRKL
ncbi:MAG: ribosome biogenesis GTP-binding protein YihA/YsxC [Bacteroidetes bacterium]|nr:ribosome biogenesis GTP-binding protein YihA/YsxC [Bacteroidota bacterium]MDA0898195.1 ribosome biogenesis GTP-binding protein YihA/YsxC [Bacteroidota bacterium]